MFFLSLRGRKKLLKLIWKGWKIFKERFQIQWRLGNFFWIESFELKLFFIVLWTCSEKFWDRWIFLFLFSRNFWWCSRFFPMSISCESINGRSLNICKFPRIISFFSCYLDWLIDVSKPGSFCAVGFSKKNFLSVVNRSMKQNCVNFQTRTKSKSCFLFEVSLCCDKVWVFDKIYYLSIIIIIICT